MAEIGKKTILKYKQPNVVIGEVLEIGEIGIEVDDIDITTYGSGMFKEYMAGLKDGGELEISVLFKKDDAGQIALYNDLGGPAKTFQIVLPEGSIWEFNAYVKSFKNSIPIDDKITASITFKLTGAVSLTLGS